MAKIIAWGWALLGVFLGFGAMVSGANAESYLTVVLGFLVFNIGVNKLANLIVGGLKG